MSYVHILLSYNSLHVCHNLSFCPSPTPPIFHYSFPLRGFYILPSLTQSTKISSRLHPLSLPILQFYFLPHLCLELQDRRSPSTFVSSDLTTSQKITGRISLSCSGASVATRPSLNTRYL